jgi:hypothetical protein
MADSKFKSGGRRLMYAGGADIGVDVCVPSLTLRPLAPNFHGKRESQGLGERAIAN